MAKLLCLLGLHRWNVWVAVDPARFGKDEIYIWPPRCQRCGKVS